jgi:putative CocE/NonD family hydrolase
MAIIGGAHPRLTRGVRVPVADGITLSASLYRPRNGTPAPAIVCLTPYTIDTFHDEGIGFSDHGFAFVVADVRGRGDSEGTFVPFVHDGDDGAALVAWVAAQPWCDGNVAMWGGSYGGRDQWVTALRRPPGLRTIAPSASTSYGFHFPGHGPIFYSHAAHWCTLVRGRAIHWNSFGDLRLWVEMYWRRYVADAPFVDLCDIAGSPSDWFRDWVTHGDDRTYWDALRATPEELARVTLPILSTTGQFDGAQPGALDWYHAQLAAVPPDAGAEHFLVIGAWDHAGVRTPTRTVGGLTMGPLSLLDVRALQIQWYAWRFGTSSRPPLLRERFLYYVTGDETWRTAPSFDAATAAFRPCFLTGDAAAGAGSFAAVPAGAAGVVSYVYDPLDHRPGEAEARGADPSAIVNPHPDTTALPNWLVYHSETLPNGLLLAGKPRLSLWLAMDVPDTDIYARLEEIEPGGRRILLGFDLVRARYRTGMPTAVEAGAILEYRFDVFPFVARRLAAGSTIRLSIGASNTIHLQKNYNSGGDVGRETAADARTATVTIHHGGETPSVLHLPIGNDTPAGRIAPDDPALITMLLPTERIRDERPHRAA